MTEPVDLEAALAAQREAVIAQIRRWGEGGINEKAYHAALDAYGALARAVGAMKALRQTYSGATPTAVLYDQYQTAAERLARGILDGA